jgi:acetoin utilization deacetylase AcuC-like enzyme/ankyrin repeat protein
VATLQSLLAPPIANVRDEEGRAEGDEAELAIPATIVPTEQPDLNLRDDSNCTPCHVAILNGQLGSLRVLLEAGARIAPKCEGSPPLHMAVCMGAIDEHAEFSLEAVRLLLTHGAVPFERDDQGRTPLHWAVITGSKTALTVMSEILAASVKFVEKMKEEQQAEQQQTAEETAAIPPLTEFQDKQGNAALHLAARHRQHQALRVLLVYIAETAKPLQEQDPAAQRKVVFEALRQRNKAGMTPLHMAALSGDAAIVSEVQELCAEWMRKDPAHDMWPRLLELTNHQGLTAAQLAVKRGHIHVAKLLDSSCEVTATTNENKAPPSPRTSPSLVVAPPECLDHHTTVWPIVRGGPDPPPENVHRLTVLTKPGAGILKTAEFLSGGPALLNWDERPHRAAMADILRVHDWAYVRKIQMLCDDLEDDENEIEENGAEDDNNGDQAVTGAEMEVETEPQNHQKAIKVVTDIGHLDGDTAISKGTFAAALAAAGAVTHAVDQVIMGKVRNAFCAVRPPGHHAGPHGIVTSKNDPSGSHGFCLFNNVAIGAAYAMTVHRHTGIRRVALLDFDVHHGNGTEACVANTAPSVAKYTISTPYGEGFQQFPVYKPWHDIATDKDSIFFASVQGYGPKVPGALNAFVYPGSGATCDTRAFVGVDGEGVDGEGLVEDPDQEFVYTGGEAPPSEGPRIIDVGIPGPGAQVALWRRAWRDKIIPALVKFEPDIIFVSAGFDAHKKDEINFSYIGVQEKDFEWLTDQLVQVANRCCSGRIVSVLEGGYRIQGGLVSAFARSVASHVRALAEPHSQVWDPQDAHWERQREKQLREEAKAKKKAARLAEAEARKALAEAAEAAKAAEAAETQGEEVPKEDGGRKRRRSAVDYVALNKKLEEEAAQAAEKGTQL